MKKIFLVLALFSLSVFISGCGFFWKKDFDVSALGFYLYGKASTQEPNFELTIVPDYEKRTLSVKFLKYADPDPENPKENPGFSREDEGVIGGSNFDDFEAILESLDGISAQDDRALEPYFSVVTVSGDGEKVRYDFDKNPDGEGKELYDFYLVLSSMFAEDVY